MKIGIFTNFAQPFHTGGAERVVQQIAESMTNDFGNECFIFCQYGKYKTVFNGVQIIPVGNITDDLFINLVLSYNIDHYFIYSDWYFKFYALLKNIDKLHGSFSIIPLGFNRCRSHLPHNKVLRDMFEFNSSRFSVALHSGNYCDAAYCRDKNYEYNVIPNGVDLAEFNNADPTRFLSKYNLHNKKIILSVGNFFPGKGQSHLLEIVQNLKNLRNDFVLCSISTNLEFAIGKKLHQEFIDDVYSLQLPIVDLQNISRQDVIDAFTVADIFVTASEQEVSPLVLLESMAAKTPWVSMNVGNAQELDGGIIIQENTNSDGKKTFNHRTLDKYIENIQLLLNKEHYCEDLGEQGYRQIVEIYNWEKIKYQYKELFYGKNISSNASL